MYKSGAILGMATLVIVLGIALLSPLCTPCAVICLGLGAGYLAGWFDKPPNKGTSAKAGTIAGSIGSAGALLGIAAGSVLNALLMDMGTVAASAELFGLEINQATYASEYQAGIACYAVCLGILNIALMAGLGAVGGLLWWQTTGKSTSPLGDKDRAARAAPETLVTSQYERYSSSGSCDVCGGSVGPNEAYLVPVGIFYASKRYKDWLKTNPMGQLAIQMTGGNVESYLQQMRAMDTTSHSAVCPKCIDMFEVTTKPKKTAQAKGSSKKRYVCPHCGDTLTGDAAITVEVSMMAGVVDFQTNCSSCGKIIRKRDVA